MTDDGAADGGAEPIPARAAATVVLVRPEPRRPVHGFEVLLLRKGAGTPFAAGAWVFPGGAIDPADRDVADGWHTASDLERRAQRLRVPVELVRGWHVAAVREAFEEAGLLLARPGPSGTWPDAQDRERVRRGLIAGDLDAGAFHAWLRSRGCLVDTAALALLRRWITPRSEPRRFDTLFLLAEAPQDQEAWADRAEVTEHRWIAPAAALRAAEDGLLPLIHPTVQTLRALEACATIGDARGLGGHGDVPAVLPHITTDATGSPVILEPGDPGYPDELICQELPEWAE